ncbi:MAG: hypothetical protein E5X80_07585 [Mesorhizobium sp.]|uniref:hypothetical protein n=1 Tax=Mesorhizobium sp. TaxID=1871066 RepID=UPI000FE4D22A|nr:hypothetical protein [Mesorhizobium sp.]RWM10295.1 MAG: hypothetical protein EOR71_05880 [Mesorhizobium sp.]TIO52309.1 MAG: hypothetical protein E5X78_12960 [Mesorhizobium sp.]TIO61195.1 MAG: hypothetical protein E5X79_08320 [Mesorhizobium sp.]TJV66030.1 MAG: hypothetical protein E5X80_07585 [Mesorhizobium sp.]
MTVIQGRATANAIGLDARGGQTWIMTLCLLVLAAAIPWQMRWGVIPDTSWAITMCERVLAGSRLYVDVFEVNPPFTPWLFMPAVALAHEIGISPETAIHAYSYAVCLAGLGLAAQIARRAGFAENRALFSMLPLFLALLVIFPGNAFSEREHLGTALLLPLLVLTAWRAAPIEGRTPSLPIAALAGLSGSVLVMVKPYYALVVLAPALYVAWRRRSIWPLFAPEYWVIGLVCVAYLLAVLHFYPEFISVIYPVLADTYMRVRDTQLVLTIYGPSYVLALWMLRFLRPGQALSPLVAVFTLASLAATVPLIYQAKGWPYHAFPAFSLVLGALLLRVAQPNPAAERPPNARIELARKALLAAVVVIAANPLMDAQKPSSELVAKVKAAVQQPTVALVGSDIAVGHPLTRMLGGTWISSYCSDWLAGLSLYLSAIETQAGNQVAANHYRQVANRYIDGKLAELEAKRPAVIIVQKTDRGLNAELSRRQDYIGFMRDYRQIAEDNGMQVMLRNAGVSQAGSPAEASN